LTNVSLMFPVPLAAALLTPLTAARLHANVVPEVLLAAVYVNGAPLVADDVKPLDNCGIAFTVNTAALELTVPALLLQTARYCLLLSAIATVNDNVAVVAPVIFVHVVPVVLDCHCTVGVGVPLAAEVKLAFAPAHLDCDAGCVVTDGATAVLPVANTTSTQ